MDAGSQQKKGGDGKVRNESYGTLVIESAGEEEAS